VVGLHPEGSESMTFQVMFEKLPKFCEICGLFGHGELECGDGVHNIDRKQYGQWMIAPMEDWHPQFAGLHYRAPTRDGGQSGLGGRGRED
jgi:hypothetical protein